MTEEKLPAPLASPGAPLKPKTPSRWPWVLVLLFLAAALAGVMIWGETHKQAQPPEPAAHQPTGPSAKPDQPHAIAPPPPSAQGKVVDVTPAEQGQPPIPPSREQAQRKQPYGLEKSVDAVVRSDESIRLGDKQVPVQELERKLVVESRGALLDKPLDGGKVSAWGVHAVRPGDSLWTIHYGILREYLASRGFKLPQQADQPTNAGLSSGVGKVLKFAEHMVGVYNLKTGHMTRDLDLLEPGQKVVVFNLSEIFDQLAQIDPKDLSGVMYDGRVLLFPQAHEKVPPPEVTPPKP